MFYEIETLRNNCLVGNKIHSLKSKNKKEINIRNLVFFSTGIIDNIYYLSRHVLSISIRRKDIIRNLREFYGEDEYNDYSKTLEDLYYDSK